VDVLRGALLYFGAVLLAGRPGYAMEMLQSFPTARAVVTGHNAQYAVRFDTVVNHRISRLTITRQGQVAQNLQVILRSDPKSLTASAPLLPPGEYELHWSAISMSGETSEGAVPFTVMP